MITYYLCNTCGNLIEKIADGHTTPSCCGHPMQELRPASTDGAIEKHIPVLEKLSELHPDDENACCGKKPSVQYVVRVGSAPHPMTSIHSIQWITVETDRGIYHQYLTPDMAPEAIFCIPKEEQICNVYAYCNLHGLLRADLP